MNLPLVLFLSRTKAALNKITREVQINAHITNNLVKLAKGIVYDTDTDDDEAIVKTVPAGAARYAELEKWGGKTIVWNQMVKNGNFADGTNEWTREYQVTYSVSDGEMTFNTQIARNGINQHTGYSLVAGHKYYLCITAKSDDDTAIGIGNILSTGVQFTFDLASTYAKQSRVITASIDASNTFYIFSTAENTTVVVKNVMFIDLTRMFGAGNEPTAAEFEAMFPEPYYPYSAPTLLSSDVSAVKTVGKNLWTKQNSYTISAPNFIVGGGTYVSSASFVLPKGTYTFSFKCSASANTEIRLFDENGYDSTSASVTANVRKSITITLTRDVTRIGWYVDAACTVSDIQVEVGSTATSFEPYRGTIATYTIPAAVRALEGYGLSAGAVDNTVEYDAEQNKWLFHKRVGSVDLGTLNYVQTVAGNNVVRATGIQNIKLAADGTTLANAFMANYTQKGMSPISATDLMCFAINYVTDDVKALFVYKENTTAEGFKTANNGVMLYYELATEVVTDITELMADFDNYLDTEQGGTIEFVQSNTPALPVPSTVNYMIKLEEAI